jgi:hypothetical protein
MKRRALPPLLLLTALLALSGCADAGFIDITAPPPPPTEAQTPVIPTTPSPEPTFDEARFLEENGPEGLTALEFAEEYPAPACDEIQFGYLTCFEDGKITFDEALWLTGDDVPYGEPYAIETTGRSITLEAEEDCQFWILWVSNWMYPARVGEADFIVYCGMPGSPLPFHFYISDDRVMMVCEQYRE